MIELPIRVAAPDVSHVDALASGTRLGEFEVRGLIGVGGFGMVYRAYDRSLQRDVAIKEYMPTGLACREGGGLNVSIRASNDEETFQTGLRSFVDEARMLAKFEHPSLVRVFRFWEANNTAYMVMPFYRGMTLKQARQCMRLPPTEAWLRKVLWAILGALKVLHRGQALHRDVSPDNIFLQDSGPPVLLDLGAARLAIGESAKQHTAILKINYAPIEQYADAHGLPQGPWTDLYALAAVVHGLVRNESPLPSVMRVVDDKLPSFANVVKTVSAEFGQNYSEEFVSGITWALHIQPQDRPQSVRDLVRALAIGTPIGMSTFDWRAELGPGCLPVGDVLRLVSTNSATAEAKTRPGDTDPHFAPTQFIDPDDVDPDATLVAQPQPPVERRKRPREPIGAVVAVADSRPAALAVSRPAELGPHSTRPAELGSSRPAELGTSRPADLDRDSVARRKKPPHSRSPSRHSAEQPVAVKQRSTGIWIMVSVLALSLVMAVGWGMHNWSARTKAAAANLQAMSDAAVVQPAAAASDVALASSAVGAEAALPKPEPKEEIIESSLAPAQSASAVAADKAAKAKERAARLAAAKAKEDAARPPPVVEPSAPAPVVVAPPPPEPKPAPPVVTPEKLCADAGAFSRSMCMFHACQRADLAGTPGCIELQKTFQRNREVN